MAGWFAYNQMLDDGGHFVAGASLQPSTTATVVHNATGAVTDGPFVETKEQIGGFYVVRRRDLDEALVLARRCRPRAPSRCGRSCSVRTRERRGRPHPPGPRGERPRARPPRGPARRPRPRRRRRPGRAARGGAHLADAGRARQPGGLADDGRPPQGRRPDPAYDVRAPRTSAAAYDLVEAAEPAADRGLVEEDPSRWTSPTSTCAWCCCAATRRSTGRPGRPDPAPGRRARHGRDRGGVRRPEATVTQRVVRAKRKIRDAGIPLTIPAALDERVEALLDGALPGLQRGLPEPCVRRRAAGRPRRPGDPADPAGARAAARLGRGRRPARARALPARPLRDPRRRRRRPGPARAPGPDPVGPRADRRGQPAARVGARRRAARHASGCRPSSPPSTPTPARTPTPTGPRSRPPTPSSTRTPVGDRAAQPRRRGRRGRRPARRAAAARHRRRSRRLPPAARDPRRAARAAGELEAARASFAARSG